MYTIRQIIRGSRHLAPGLCLAWEVSSHAWSIAGRNSLRMIVHHVLKFHNNKLRHYPDSHSAHALRTLSSLLVGIETGYEQEVCKLWDSARQGQAQLGQEQTHPGQAGKWPCVSVCPNY